MNNIYKGKTQEQWIDAINKKLIELERTMDSIVVNNQVNARAIPFSSSKFKARNVGDALDESRGLVINQFDILKTKYKEDLTVKQALDVLFKDYDHHFNDGAIQLVGEIQQVVNKTEALDELLMLGLRLTLENKQLKERLDALETKTTADIYNT